MKTVYSRVWEKFILSYVENLNIFKSKCNTKRDIKEGDLVIYSGLNKEMSPINSYQICQVIGITLGRDGDNQQRSLTVKLLKGNKRKDTVFTRNIRRFSLLEIDDLITNEQTQNVI